MSGTSGANKSLPNVVAGELRGLIVRGSLLPGEHLGQTQLAARFGRSKVPIREALKLLATEGFLLHDRNRGYFVAPLESDEARQLYRLRRWLEARLLETAAWPDAATLAGLEARFEELGRIDPARDYRSWASALESLRHALFDLSPEKALLREAVRLWTLTDRYRALLPRTDEESPERQLLGALKAQDRAALLKVYHQARGRIEAALEQALQDRQRG